MFFADLARAAARVSAFSRPLEGDFSDFTPFRVAARGRRGGAFGTAAAVEVVLTGGVPGVAGVLGGVAP